jgi:hypothetical protein
MPSCDQRHDVLANELRAAKPTASPELRERIAALEEPAALTRRILPRVSTRRAVLVLAPACLIAGVGAALIHGVFNSGGGVPRAAKLAHGAAATRARALAPYQTFPAQTPGKAGFAPARRLQRYDVQLKLRVRNLDGLSSATKRAMNATRRYGGYVASVTYSSFS